jgi:enediyne biosynthesis thioesterase
MRSFEMRHVVSFEDTNVVGNVYYVNHLKWQGRCRELFLRTHSPELLERMGKDLSVVTVRCSCEYLAELVAFDEIVVRMRLACVTQGRITMRFDYYRVGTAAEQLVARGEQEVACMRRNGGQLIPAAWPASFAGVVGQFGG